MNSISQLPLVSFIVVARNASKHLPDLLSDLAAQDYPAEQTEIILVDGLSSDGTRAVMEQFATAHSDRVVKVLDNSKYTLSAGWNVALAQANGDVIIRVDAHSRIPPDFIGRNVERIMSGEDIVGGPTLSKMPTESWAQLLALAERSRFGGSAAAFRNPGPPRYVDTLAYAAYRRSVFEKVGGFDERLVRNQDVEIHYRMRSAGYRFFFDPDIRSYYVPRSNLPGFLKQKFETGLWVGRVLGIGPGSFRLRHFVPALFTIALFVTVLWAFLSNWMPLALLGGVYGLSAMYFTARAMKTAPIGLRTILLLLPLMFLLLHVAYGSGTWSGLIGMPLFMHRHRHYQIPFPVTSE